MNFLHQIRIALLLALVCLTARPASADTPRERFLRNNPNYAKRSGEFYERDYLPTAVKTMVEMVNHPNLGVPQAEEILKAAIYSMLESYENGGVVTRAEHARVVADADDSVARIVKNPAALERFKKWRRIQDREVNPLTFLFTHEYHVDFQLPAKMKEAGWTLNRLDRLDRLAAYKPYFNTEPDMVLELENPKLSKPGKRAFLTVAFFPIERVRDQLLQEESPYQPPRERQNAAKPLPPLDLFWSDHSNVLLAAEGDFPQEQARLAAAIRRSLIVPPRPDLIRVPID